jgi:hypothetical protein
MDMARRFILLTHRRTHLVSATTFCFISSNTSTTPREHSALYTHSLVDGLVSQGLTVDKNRLRGKENVHHALRVQQVRTMAQKRRKGGLTSPFRLARVAPKVIRSPLHNHLSLLDVRARSVGQLELYEGAENVSSAILRRMFPLASARNARDELQENKETQRTSMLPKRTKP